MKSALSVVLAILLLCSTLPAPAQSSANEEAARSLAETYFGWDPDIVVEFDDIKILGLLIDEKPYLFATTIAGSSGILVYRNPSTLEPIVTVYNHFAAFKPGVDFKLHNYFDRMQKVGYVATELILHSFISTKTSRDLPEVVDIMGKQHITLEELARAMLAIDISKSDYTWYTEANLPSLDKLTYRNTVPSGNDSDLIEKDRVGLGVQFLDDNTAFKDTMETNKFFFYKRVIEGEFTYFVEIFTDEEIIKMRTKMSIRDFLANNLGLNKPEYKGWGSLHIESYNWDFVPILRECLETIDGKEYYNVGKLRKLFEAFDPIHHPDYSMYLAGKPTAP